MGVIIQGAPPIAADPGFSDFVIFRKMSILGIFQWDLGSGMVCNRLEMVVGFKYTDSQVISSHMGPFCTIFIFFDILVSFSVVWRCFREVPGPVKTALTVLGPCENVLPNWSQLLGTCLDLSELVGTSRKWSELVGTTCN